MYRHLNAAVEWIESADNTWGFTLRQQILEQMAQDTPYAKALAGLLSQLPPVIRDWDIFGGAMEEGSFDGRITGPGDTNFAFLTGNGHIIPAYDRLLKLGLKGLLDEVPASDFRESCAVCVQAIICHAHAYAHKAREMVKSECDPLRKNELIRMAAALENVPENPARDLFEALQCIWFIHHIFSCCIGSRDYAFPLMDELLMPYYSGNEEEALELLCAFACKCKSITGTATDVYKAKPVPCFASNQYFTVGGRHMDGSWNYSPMTGLILRMCRETPLPQPEVNVRIDPDAPAEFQKEVAETMLTCGHKVQLWNERMMLTSMERYFPAIEQADRYHYAFTACNRIAFPGEEAPFYAGAEIWVLLPKLMLQFLPDRADNMEQIIQPVLDKIVEDANARVHGWICGKHPVSFHLESLFVNACRRSATDVTQRTAKYKTMYPLLSGLATLVDSFCAIEWAVFTEKIVTYEELMCHVRNDFAGAEELRQKLLNQAPKYGNGIPKVDALTRRVTEVLLDGIRSHAPEDGYLKFASIYSLYANVGHGKETGTTPDGRLAGEPTSENESPTRGMDRSGLTALLTSTASIAQDRSPMGGLNLMFSGSLDVQRFTALANTYFKMGGKHLGYTQITRKQLLEAEADPKAHRSLCVRLTGFSEYFIALSPEHRKDVIERTVY